MHVKEEEHIMLHYSILLPLVKKVLERDLQLIEKGPFKLKDPYYLLINESLRSLHEDARKVKSFMHQRKMKAFFVENDGMFSRYTYTCRGYEGSISYLNANLKRQARHSMDAYFKGKSPLEQESVLHS